MHGLGLRRPSMAQTRTLGVIQVCPSHPSFGTCFTCFLNNMLRMPRGVGGKTTDQRCSHHKSESMVSSWRSSLHHRGLGHGAGHDTWSWLPLLWSGTTEICPEHDMGLYGLLFHHHLSMVLLGLLSSLFQYGHQRLHRRSTTFRLDEHTR